MAGGSDVLTKNNPVASGTPPDKKNLGAEIRAFHRQSEEGNSKDEETFSENF